MALIKFASCCTCRSYQFTGRGDTTGGKTVTAQLTQPDSNAVNDQSSTMVAFTTTCGIMYASGTTCPNGYGYSGPDGSRFNITTLFNTLCCVSAGQLKVAHQQQCSSIAVPCTGQPMGCAGLGGVEIWGLSGVLANVDGVKRGCMCLPQALGPPYPVHLNMMCVALLVLSCDVVVVAHTEHCGRCHRRDSHSFQWPSRHAVHLHADHVSGCSGSEGKVLVGSTGLSC